MRETNIPVATTQEDMMRGRAWARRFLSDPASLPVSLVFGSQPITGIPDDWKPVTRTRRIDANILETVFEGHDANTGLSIRVETLEYRDYPVVEWMAWLTNTGSQPSPILSNIMALDGTFEGTSPVLYHCNGDFYSEEGYTPRETPLRPEESLRFAPNGGRPCDGAFPYYRIMFEDGGLTLAIGWPAQWAATFAAVSGGVHVRAGQEKTHLRLLPGESIRTPRMTVLFWTGDASRAANLWRRWYLAHVLPRPDGQPMRPLLACACTDEGEEFTAATEENQLRYIEMFKQRGIRPDVWWIDAGWYPCYNKDRQRRWWITGDWRPDPERFPRGLKPISDLAAQNGTDLLVWFEPERIHPEAHCDPIRPEWLLRTKPDDLRLLNLGNPECRQWLTDTTCRLIQDNGIRIYRQDHNFPPLEHWRSNEPPDRQGMNENLHVQGYLRFWDDLLARNPGLWIDSCASGGRRNDLETMRRSVPLHYTDYGYGIHPVKLGFHRTLFEWLPYFKEVNLSWDMEGGERRDARLDSFAYHCGLGPMFFSCADIRRDDTDVDLMERMLALWRRASGLMLGGDYYPHTPFHHSAEEWVAWQFDSPETGRGFIQGIRLPACPDESLTIRPKALRADAVYLFENPEAGETREIPGSALIRDGFTLRLPKRAAAIWFYRTME